MKTNWETTILTTSTSSTMFIIMTMFFLTLKCLELKKPKCFPEQWTSCVLRSDGNWAEQSTCPPRSSIFRAQTGTPRHLKHLYVPFSAGYIQLWILRSSEINLLQNLLKRARAFQPVTEVIILCWTLNGLKTFHPFLSPAAQGCIVVIPSFSPTL